MPRKPKPGPWHAGGSAVAERPSLATKIAVIANTWTSIEGHVALALGAMIGSDHQVALAILSKVKTATARAQMIEVVADATLDPRLKPELKAIMKSFAELARRRNDVVHGLWGVSDSEPDGLLKVPADGTTRITLGLPAAMAAGNPLDLIESVLTESELWEAAEFDALIASLSELSSKSILFATKLQSIATGKLHGISADQIIREW